MSDWLSFGTVLPLVRVEHRFTIISDHTTIPDPRGNASVELYHNTV